MNDNRKPALQNIPIRTKLGREIRDAFLPKNRSVLESVDYSDLEKRVVEQLGEEALYGIKKGKDHG